MELLVECEREYRAPAPSIPPSNSHFPLPCHPFSIRGTLLPHRPFKIRPHHRMKDEERGGKWERDMERKRERGKKMPRYTGSRSYRLFLYPEQIIFFVFQRAARLAEALIVTASLSYGSGKLRTVKAFLRQAASRNPPRRFLRISGTCRARRLTKRSYEQDRSGSINVDSLTILLHRVLFHLFPFI